MTEQIYASNKRAPLARVPNRFLPHHIDPYENTFGMQSEKSTGAKECINPDKTRPIVEMEASSCHDNYVFSHKSYEPGEQKNSRFVAPFSASATTFGLKTPVYYDGRQTKKALDWLPITNQLRRFQSDASILDTFKEKHSDQIGKSLDPNKDTRYLGADHIFGITNRNDNYSAGDILHGRQSNNILKGKDKQRAFISSVRTHLSNFNCKFPTLYDAFKFYDKVNSSQLLTSKVYFILTISFVVVFRIIMVKLEWKSYVWVVLLVVIQLLKTF
jgi:EF-hand domain-containing family member B